MSAAAPDPRLVGALGVTLIHFFWQGALIAALLGGVHLALRRASAQLRYLAGCLALLLMVVTPIATFLRASADRAIPATPAPAAWSALDVSPAVPSSPIVPPSPAVPSTPLPPRSLAPSPTSAPSPPSLPAPIAASHPMARWVATLERWIATPPPGMLLWLVGIWSLGVVILSLRLLGGWVVTQRLRRAVATEAPAALQEMLARLAVRLRVSRPVQLCQSLLVEVPTVVGWLKPAILLPMSTLSGLTPQQIEAVLAHELAHIRRHDYLVNLCQTVAETLLFYHPAVWWVSRQIRDERENCCDDEAVAACGDVLVYARALCELEQLRVAAPELAMAANGGSLVQRIRRLMGPRPARPGSPSRWVAGALAMGTVLLVVVAAGFQPVDGRSAAKPVAIAAAWLATTPVQAIVRPLGVIAPVDPVNAVDAVDAADPADAVDATAEPHYVLEPVTSDVQWVDVEHLVLGAKEVLRVVQPMRVLAAAQAELACKQEQAQQAVQKLVRERAEKLIQESTDGELVRALAKTGIASLTVEQLVELPKHGVDAEFIEGMADAGYPVESVDDLIQFANHGVTPEYVKGLADAGCTGLSSQDLIELANHGVTPEWVGAMQFLGYSKLSAEQLIQLSSHGVDTEYVSTLRAMGYRSLGVEDLIQLASHGVTPDFVAELWGAGLRHLSTEDLVRLRDQGVDASLITALRGSGYAMKADDIVQLAQHGIDADYVMEISTAGLRRIEPEDWIRLHDAGVDGRFVSAVLELRGSIATSDLIQMKQSGESPRRERTRTR